MLYSHGLISRGWWVMWQRVEVRLEVVVVEEVAANGGRRRR